MIANVMPRLTNVAFHLLPHTRTLVSLFVLVLMIIGGGAIRPDDLQPGGNGG